jgi:hypothetical protein
LPVVVRHDEQMLRICTALMARHDLKGRVVPGTDGQPKAILRPRITRRGLKHLTELEEMRSLKRRVSLYTKRLSSLLSYSR